MPLHLGLLQKGAYSSGLTCRLERRSAGGLMDMWHAGGCSLFATLRDRLERELADAAPQTAKVKVTSPANATERRFAVWIGVLPFSPSFIDIAVSLGLLETQDL